MLVSIARAALLATTMFACFPAAALAQEATDQTKREDPAAADGLSEIMVTATRTSQSVQKVPVAVTAISGEAIERLQITNAKDLTQIAPNVTIVGVTGGSAGIAPYIRGGGVTDGATITSEPEVGIYIDDIYQARSSASFLEALDIDRIEVLRGPQGTLYGRNSSAGALKIVTRVPGETMAARAEIGYGTWNERYAKLAMSGPVTSDGRLRAGFSGIIRARDGGRQYDSTLGRDVGAEQYQGFQGDIYYAGTSVTARLKAFYSNLSGDGLYAVGLDPNYTGSDYKAVKPASGSYRTVLSPFPSGTTARQWGTSFHLNAQLIKGWELTSITAYSHLDDSWAIDFSGGVANSVLGIGTSGYSALFERTSVSSEQSFSQELQLHGEMADGLLSLIAGLFYFHEEGNQSLDSVIFFTPSSSRYAINTDSYAAFAQLSVHFTDKLTFAAGGRYTEDDKSINATVNGTPVVRSDKFRDFLPKLGLDYQLTPQVLLYASYSEGFKAGGYSGLADSAAALNSPFAPQKVKAYEIGFKSEFLDRRARLNVSAFINDYSSIQQQYVSTSGQFLTESYVATHKGVEAEFSIRPVQPLTLWVNGVYNDGVYNGGASSGNATSFVGNQMTNVFKYQATVGGDLSLPLGPGTFVLGANYSAKSDYYATPDNFYVGHVPATYIVNGYVGYDLGKWSLRLSGKNLTDDRYWTTGFGFSVINPRFLGDPRTLKASLAYKF